jgi:replication initiator protein RepSA
MADTTIGRAFTGKDGQAFRPSMFLTVTLPSYGRVTAEGVPADPSTYDYTRAARDAIAFPRLLDRLVQNLRRVAGYDMQYFVAVEPQRRLTAHAHFAIRGTIPRALLRQVIAATYHQVWCSPPANPSTPKTTTPLGISLRTRRRHPRRVPRPRHRNAATDLGAGPR